MKSNSPTLEGFRVMLREPSFGLAEIAWRWSFGAACLFGLAFAVTQYLKSLTISGRDLFLLRTRQPTLIVNAIAHIFRDSAFRAMEAVLLLTAVLAIAWVTLCSLARASTLKSLFSYFREDATMASRQVSGVPLRSLFGLSFFRVVVTLAAALGCVSAFVIGSLISPASNPAPGSAFLVISAITLLVWLAWSILNWFLSLAAVFVVADGRSTFDAIASAVDLCRRRTASVLAAGSWFGVGHIAVFLLATSVVAFPLGFAGVLPAGVVLGGVLLVTLLYFAAADFLYIGRLAAYVAILELPEPTKVEAINYPTNTPGLGESAAVDPTELILSDVPSQA